MLWYYYRATAEMEKIKRHQLSIMTTFLKSSLNQAEI